MRYGGHAARPRSEIDPRDQSDNAAIRLTVVMGAGTTRVGDTEQCEHCEFC